MCANDIEYRNLYLGRMAGEAQVLPRDHGGHVRGHDQAGIRPSNQSRAFLIGHPITVKLYLPTGHPVRVKLYLPAI